MKRKKSPDAIDLLDADHLFVHALFERYRDLVSARATAPDRRALAEQICMELTIHGKLEDELFYPAVREALYDDDIVDEAEEQHGSAREFIAQILTGSPEDELYDAKVAVLADYVERHVRQEREVVFNRLLASGCDLHALATALASRKEELRAVVDALREETLSNAQA